MRVYFDYNASTPIDPGALEAMRPFLSQHQGNPSADHWAARPAKQALERARGQVAGLLDCPPQQVVFTSGGSESNNMAIKGTFYAAGRSDAEIITSTVEHPAVSKPCDFLRKQGARVITVPVDGTGMVDPDDVRRAISPKTVLITIMQANNEVGTIQPIKEIAHMAREQGVTMHTDAAQAVGKIDTRPDQLGVHLLSLAGHKVYAPKGVGALYLAPGTKLEPLIHGAGHEGGLRAGTENVLLIVGLGEACARAAKCLPLLETQALRDEFWQGLKNAFGAAVTLNGHPSQRLPNTLHVSFPGQLGPAIIEQMAEVAVSAGAACHTGATEISPVLRAMGTPVESAAGSIRFSLGRDSSRAEVDYVIDRLKDILPRPNSA